MTDVPAICVTAVAHYLSKGITKDIAVGIASVLYHESNLNPLAENNSGTDAGGVINPKGAYGIAQWNGPRQAPLASFAKLKNEDPSQLTTQLDFVLTECANSYPKVWAAIQQPGMTYQDFITIFVQNYERPANEMAEVNAAMAIAAPLYELSISPTAAAPTPAVVAPTSVQPGDNTLMDQALITALAPIVESLAAGLFKALLAQLSATTPGATPGAAPTPAPAVDLNSLVTQLLPPLLSQLSTVLPGLVSAEVAKLTPPVPTVKS